MALDWSFDGESRAARSSRGGEEWTKGLLMEIGREYSRLAKERSRYAVQRTSLNLDLQKLMVVSMELIAQAKELLRR